MQIGVCAGRDDVGQDDTAGDWPQGGNGLKQMTKATYTDRYADLASEFGYSTAVRWFGQDAIDSLPVRKSGKNKGKPAGFLRWLSTATPGYSVYVSGGVAAGVTVRAWVGVGPFSGQSDAVQALWLGRTQSLCGSKALLSQEGRKAFLAV